MFNMLKKKNNKTIIQDYIKVYDNIINHDLCDLIVNEYSESNEWGGGTVSKSGRVDRSQRNVDGIPISDKEIINDNFETRHKIDSDLFEVAGRSINLYNNDFPRCNVQEDVGYTLLRYKEGQFYKEHTDSFKERPRMVTGIFSLNDDYKGGEFAFFQKSVTYKMKKGSVLLFPSNFMYPHEVLKVTEGTRFSIVTWFI